MVLAAARSPYGRPEEDPFLLLETALKAVQSLLRNADGLPLRRTWIDCPYGEEEITILEEEVLPALERCIERVDAIDADLQRMADARYYEEVRRDALLRAGCC